MDLDKAVENLKHGFGVQIASLSTFTEQESEESDDSLIPEQERQYRKDTM